MAGRHALLIGIDKYQHLESNRLEGCVNDAKAMRKLLRDRGFETELLRDKKATRQGIFDAVGRLIRRIRRRDDVAILFFAGHGARSQILQAETIVPVDSGRKNAPATDIFDWEIAGWIRELNAKTPNVTLIFDACHSGDLTRSGGEPALTRDREAPGVEPDMFAEDARPRPPASARRSGRRGPSRWLPPLGRDAVVLAACAASQKAREKKKHGVYTSFLRDALDRVEPGSDVTWGEVHRQVARAMAAEPQDPQIEGDVDRGVFDHRRHQRQPSLQVVAAEKRAVDLAGGVLDGVEKGSRWALLPREAKRRGDGEPIATVEVEQLGLLTCRARVVDSKRRPKVGQRAFPDPPPASPESRFGSGPRLDLLRGLQNRDPGSALRRQVDAGRIGLRVLRREARGFVDLEMEPLGDGAFRLQPALSDGDRLEIEIENRIDRAVWVNLVQVNVDGEVGLLWPRTDHAEYRAGYGLAAGERRRWAEDYLGDDPDFGALTDGVALEIHPPTPQGARPLPALDPETAPQETLVFKLVVAAEKLDLRVLEAAIRAPGLSRGRERLSDQDIDWATLTVEAPVLPQPAKRRGDGPRDPPELATRELATRELATRDLATEESDRRNAADPLGDLEVRIGGGDGDGDYPLFVGGVAAGTVHLEPATLGKRLRALENAPLTLAAGSGGGLLHRKNAAMKRAQGVGRKLFEALMPPLLGRYRAAREQGRGLRLRLDVEAPELAALPWELLHGAVGEGPEGHLCLLADAPVVRQLERSTGGETRCAEPPFRILGMVAKPEGLEVLDVEREAALMEAAVHHLTEAGVADLVWVDGESEDDLLAALEESWNAFHFIGHGGFDPAAGEAYIALAGVDRRPHHLVASRLAEILGGRQALRLVVLNSCKGARGSDTDLFASFGPRLEDQGIPAVVAMQYEITDAAAIHFSALLYDGLARGLGVDVAVTAARRAIHEDLRPTVEWGTPVLQMRSRDGRLLSLDFAAAIFRPSTAAVRRRRRRDRRQKLSESGLRQRLEELQRRLLELQEVQEESLSWAAGRPLLLAKVEEFWGAGGAAFFRPAAGAGRRVLELADAEGEALGPNAELAAVLDRPEVGGSMLILGPPGAGKSTALLEVLGGLCAAARDDPRAAVPLRLDLSDWRLGEPLVDWLTYQLSRRYGVPPRDGRGWLEEGRLALLLDGLDEVAPGAQTACVEAINAFVRDRRPLPESRPAEGTSRQQVSPPAQALQQISPAGPAPQGPLRLVVCCGLREYLELPARLEVAAAVRLEVLGRDRLLGALRSSGEPAGLTALLQRSPALQVQARSPIWLRFLRQVYPHLSTAAERRLAGLDDARDIREQLLDAYVESRLRAAAGGER